MTGQGGAPSAPPLGRRLVGGAGWAFLGRALALPLGFLQTMLLARLLVPADLGTYFLAMTLATLAAALSQIGMGRTMVKLVASALADDRPRAARGAIIVAVVTTLGAGGVVAIALADGPGRWIIQLLEAAARLEVIMGAIALLVVLLALIDLFAEICRGFHDLRGASLFGHQLLHRLVLVLMLGLIWAGGWAIDLGDALRLALVSALGTALLAAWLLLGKLRTLASHGEPWRVGAVLRHGPPFLMVHLNLWILVSADLWVLGMFQPPEEVAIYGAAARVALFVGMPLMVANTVLAPTVAAMFGRAEPARLERLIRTAATLSALAALGLLLVLVGFGEPLLRLAFTDAYGAAYPVLVCLAVGQWANVAFGSCGIALNMTGHQRDVMVASTVASLITVGAFILVAGPYGALGIAAVAATSLVLYNVSLAILARHRLGIRTWLTLSPSAFRQVGGELGPLLGRRA